MSIKTSFITGARSSQRDWFFNINLTINNENMILYAFGDGHSYWRPDKEVDLLKKIILNNFSNIVIDESFLKFSINYKKDIIYNENSTELLKKSSTILDKINTTIILDIIYQKSVGEFIEKYQNNNIGTSIIFILSSKESTSYISHGDSYGIFKLPNGDTVIPDCFSWDSDKGIEISNILSEIINYKYIGMELRSDAFNFENRKMPKFAYQSISFVPETLGIICGDEINVLTNNPTVDKIYKYECSKVLSGISDNINIRASSILLFEGNPDGLEFLLATDGITSKGSLGLDYSCIKLAYQLLQSTDTHITEVIKNNTDNIFHQFLGEPTSKNHMKFNMFKKSDGFLYNKENYDSFLKKEEEFKKSFFYKFMKKWELLGIADKSWWEAINYSLEYFIKYPNINISPNKLDWIAHSCVIQMSDDNVSLVHCKI